MFRLMRSLLAAAAIGGLIAATVPSPAQDSPAQKEKDKDVKGAHEAVEVFKDRAGEYRWRVTDADGKVIAMTPKGYDTKADCLKALASVKAILGKAKVTEVPDAPKKDK